MRSKHRLQRNIFFRWMWRSLLIITLFSSVGCSSNALQTSSLPSLAQRLPELQIWKQGVSSFLFGANDTQEWSQNNVESSPEIQESLKDAHFSLMRTFFFDKSPADGHATTDAEIEQRLETVENSGMTCLGVLQNIFDVAFDEHVVTYAGSRCQLYEFGNEPDDHGISIETYLQQWNTTIPLLRKINPNVTFIGPVTSNDQGTNGFMRAFLEGVKTSGILPDAVSFHWYPCYQDTQASCLRKASSSGLLAEGVQAMVRQILGKDIPVGITEWNYNPGTPPLAYGDDSNFITRFSTDALQSMALAGVAFACQFDIASYGGYGRLDMFNIETNQPKPQYYALKNLIQLYRPPGTPVQAESTPMTALSPTTASLAQTGPLISRGKPVSCSGNDVGAGGLKASANGHSEDWLFWHPSFSDLPSWCAIQVGAGPTRLLLIWDSDYSFDYISDKGLGPQDYSIAVSADSTNGADGTWRTVVSVSGNHTRVREHLLPFAGQSWVKMTINKGQTQASQPYIFVDQINLYDVSSSLNDTFFFSGDSLTAIAYDRFDASQPSFADLVHASFPQHFPAMLDGGIGGWHSDDAVQKIDLWLTLNPDMHYWLLGWGTNDAFKQVPPDHFRANLQTLVDKIKQAGHVPILAHIPYVKVNGLNQEVQLLNAVIDQVRAANGLMSGPDLYQLFLTHQTTYFLADGIHPNAEGAKAMNLAWFQVLTPVVYQ